MLLVSVVVGHVCAPQTRGLDLEQADGEDAGPARSSDELLTV